MFSDGVAQAFNLMAVFAVIGFVAVIVGGGYGLWWIWTHFPFVAG